ncbi:MAG TPA: YCF48-related protein, partial [Ignavibacteriaceae bacterium]
MISAIVLVLFSNQYFAQVPEPDGWYKLKSPVNETLRRLYFVNEKTGWAVSLGGKIINTKDSGNSWEIQNSTVTTPIVDIFFINPNRGWALTYPSEPPFGTSILKTTDGGNNWIKDSVFFQNEIFSTIFFVDENVGFIGGNGIKKTTDGGLTWLNSFIEPGGVSTLPINKFSFYSKTFGYACGGRVDIAGVVWKTTDGGESWSSIGLSPDQIYDVYIIDSLNAISLSGDPELLYPLGIIRTTDAGVNWSFTNLPFFGISFAIDFLDDKNGWSAAGYKFLNSTDGGDTWTEQFIFDSTVVYDLQFVDQYTGFACGENGVLLKYNSNKKNAPDKPIFEIG